MNNLSAVESIFFAALDKGSPEERASYLDQACGADLELRGCVERMLKAQPKVGSFLQAPAPGLCGTVDEPPITEKPGTMVGPYKLMEQIGEGGFGLVFVAEQQHPVRRKVALKVIKPGLDSGQVLARFEAERQALALMDHPNIARVLDAGTTALSSCSVTRTFVGLRSRWMTPFWWACCTAWQTGRNSSSRWRGVRRCSSQ